MIAAQPPQSYVDTVRENGSKNCRHVTTTTTAGSSRRNRTTRRSSMHLELPLLLLLLLQRIAVPAVAFPNTPRTFPFARIVVVQSSTGSQLNDDRTANPSSKYNNNTTSSIDVELEQQINQGLQRAREVLQKSKAKLAAMQQNTAGAEMKDRHHNNNDAVPFFATRRAATTTTAVANTGGGDGVATAIPTTTVAISDTATTMTTTATTTITDSRLKVKSRNSATGLVMADGERMAEISEDEPWEYRSIYELFPSSDTTDTAAANNNPAASRVEIQTDVMASIQNLRKVLQTEDYRRIFDPRNRFIGEDNWFPFVKT